VLPVLPDSSQFNPRAGDFGTFDVRIAKLPGGYDAVRANILALDGPQDVAVGATGKAMFAYLVEPSARTRPLEVVMPRAVTRTRR
jgi:hypothetical protein